MRTLIHLNFWVRPIELGDEDQIISLLLRSLLNFFTLKIYCLGHSQLCLYFTIYRITRMKGPGAPLSRLHRAYILEGMLVSLVAALPSMESIRSLSIRAAKSQIWPDDYASKTFTVRDLVLESCSINTKRLYDILEAFKALHSFTYDSDYRYEKCRRDERAKFDPFWVRKVLSFHVISTLEFLTLLSHDKDRHWMWNIRCFQTLHNLHTEMQLLLEEKNHYRDYRSLMGALPPNLETLKLECSGLGDELMIAKLITTLAQVKTRCVPALKKVEVITRNRVQDFNTSITMTYVLVTISPSWQPKSATLLKPYSKPVTHKGSNPSSMPLTQLCSNIMNAKMKRRSNECQQCECLTQHVEMCLLAYVELAVTLYLRIWCLVKRFLTLCMR